MADLAGYGFTYNPEPSQEPTQLFAWQICLAHMEEGSLEDADNFADYAINRNRIVQSLGLGMANGQNAFQLEGQLFVVAISIQVDGRITIIDAQHPRYGDVALVVAEQLLHGEDHGMVAQLPNGNLVPFTPPIAPSDL